MVADDQIRQRQGGLSKSGAVPPLSIPRQGRYTAAAEGSGDGARSQKRGLDEQKAARRKKRGQAAQRAQERAKKGRERWREENSKSAANAGRRRPSERAGAKAEIARLSRELNEALQQQAATADVLKAISRSAFDLTSVLQTLVNRPPTFAKLTKALLLDKSARFSTVRRPTDFHRIYQSRQEYSCRAGTKFSQWARPARREPGSYSGRQGGSRIYVFGSTEIGGLSHRSRCSDLARRCSDRRAVADPIRSPRIHRQANRPGLDLCGSGRRLRSRTRGCSTRPRNRWRGRPR